MNNKGVGKTWEKIRLLQSELDDLRKNKPWFKGIESEVAEYFRNSLSLISPNSIWNPLFDNVERMESAANFISEIKVNIESGLDQILDEYKPKYEELDNHNKCVQIIQNEIDELKASLWSGHCATFEDKCIYDFWNQKNSYVCFHKYPREVFPENQSGVYLLWGHYGLDYIGETINLRNRLSSGHEYFKKDHHIIGFIPCRKNRKNIERVLISELNPNLNKAFNLQ